MCITFALNVLKRAVRDKFCSEQKDIPGQSLLCLSIQRSSIQKRFVKNQKRQLHIEVKAEPGVVSVNNQGGRTCFRCGTKKISNTSHNIKLPKPVATSFVLFRWLVLNVHEELKDDSQKQNTWVQCMTKIGPMKGCELKAPIFKNWKK